jgi:alpha-mannosidase
MKKPIMQIQQSFNRTQNIAADRIERFVAELEFARQLIEWHPTEAKAWQPLIEKAEQVVHAASLTGEISQIESAVQSAERILIPLAATAKSYRLHLVGHAHIDMNWMWSWPETVAIVNDTFTTVLKLLEEFPEFYFTQSQASIYAIVEKYRPDMLPHIVRYVKEGRWEVAASHWVENDKNMSGSESLARHLLYTRDYMRRLFGLYPEDVPIDWCPDTFGHPATIPSYLVQGGVRYTYLHRPGNETSQKPCAFWWKAPDGAKVLVRNDMRAGYNGTINPENLLNCIRTMMNEVGLSVAMYVYGVGDHGGGPTRRDLLRGRDMATWPIFPEIEFSKAKTFFEELEKVADIVPVLEEELNFEVTGCYTTQTLIKKANRLGENRLVDMELATALSWAIWDRPVPVNDLEENWRNVLFNHFHDILPGSGVHDTRTYAHGLFQQVMASTSILETETLRHFASRVDTSSYAGDEEEPLPASRVSSAVGSGAGIDGSNGAISSAERSGGHGNRPFMIFNPTAYQRSEVIEFKIWDNAAAGVLLPFEKRSFSLQGPNGRKIPAQIIDANGSCWGHQFLTLAVPVTVPALGYTTFGIIEEKTPEKTAPTIQHLGRTHHCAYLKNEREQEGLENEFIRIEFDMATGGIRSLIDRKSGIELISSQAPAPAFEYTTEVPHGMTAWIIDHHGAIEYPLMKGYQRKANGPHKVSFEAKFRIYESDLTLVYELRAGDPRLYIHVIGTWFQRGTSEGGIPTLRLAFPLALDQARGTYEIPFGAQDRPYHQGQEVPALQWAGVVGKAGAKKAGVLLLNDSKHGHALDGNTLRLTLIRASYDPDPLPEIGSHDIHVALEPFSGELPVAKAIGSGRVFNHPLRIVGTDVHKGSLPADLSIVPLNLASCVLSGLKKAHYENALVLTFFEPTGKDQTLTAEFNPKLFGKVKSAVEVDLIERPVKNSSAQARGQKVRLKIPAHGIASMLVRFSKAGRKVRREAL